MDTEQLTRELSLKAMTAVGNIIGDYERGLISRAQAATGCRAVFDTIGGLINGETFELVSTAAHQYRSHGVEIRKARSGETYLHVCGTARLYRVRPQAVPHDAGAYNTDEPDALIKDGMEIVNL